MVTRVLEKANIKSTCRYEVMFISLKNLRVTEINCLEFSMLPGCYPIEDSCGLRSENLNVEEAVTHAFITQKHNSMSYQGHTGG